MSGRHHPTSWLMHPKRWVDHLPLESVANPTWMDLAACKGTDPEAYFPDRKPHDDNTRAAKALCARCPVRRQCLDFALDLQATDSALPGIYGGTTNKQRRELLRKRDQR